jgi:2-C-methyl-D-erythritol 4-phosphate cytidylyltransferase/2-C-methyl-D-erythritol 2,4-cyclodiphosphate synthase
MLPPMGKARASAVVVAAGAGTRLGADEPKSLLEIGGRPIVAVAVGSAIASPVFDEVVVAAPPGFEDRVLATLSDLDPPVTVVSGGETRQRSVAAALQAVSSDSDIVVIHDAARPFASPDLFTSVVHAVASGADGAVPILPLTDTVKRVRGGVVVQTEERDELGLAQTPQACRADILRAALEGAAEAGLDFTDDAGLLEWMGATVRSVPGEPGNFKITTLLDLLRADELLRGGSG